jgi:hypothetical protein
MRPDGGDARRLLRLPADSDLELPLQPGTRVVVRENNLQLVTVVGIEPRERAEQVVGRLAVAKQLDTSGIAQRLAAHGVSAVVRTPQGSVVLAGTAPSTPANEIAIPLVGPAAGGVQLVAANVGTARWPRVVAPLVLVLCCSGGARAAPPPRSPCWSRGSDARGLPRRRRSPSLSPSRWQNPPPRRRPRRPLSRRRRPRRPLSRRRLQHPRHRRPSRAAPPPSRAAPPPWHAARPPSRAAPPPPRAAPPPRLARDRRSRRPCPARGRRARRPSSPAPLTCRRRADRRRGPSGCRPRPRVRRSGAHIARRHRRRPPRRRRSSAWRSFPTTPCRRRSTVLPISPIRGGSIIR